MLNDMLLGTTSVLLQVQAQTDTADDVNDVWAGWGSVIFVLSMAAIVALIAALVIWQLFRTRQTKMMSDARVAESNAYKLLAEEAAAAQNRAATELASLGETVSDLRNRVASIERMLAEVGEGFATHRKKERNHTLNERSPQQQKPPAARCNAPPGQQP